MTKKLFCLMLVWCAVPAVADADNPRMRQHQVMQQIASDSDVKAEIQLGREVAARIIGKYPLLDNEGFTRYVNLVGKAVALHSNRPELEFSFGILDTPIVNAFAAPGGFVFVTRGAIDAMKNEAELAGVLAHEIIHITERHIVKELNIHGTDESPAEGFARLIGGATDPTRVAFVKAVDKAVNILFERGYQRRDEIESDTSGTVLMASLGYDPGVLPGYLERIKESGGNDASALKKLHPSFDERIGLIRQTITDEGLGGGTYFQGEERFHALWKKR